MPARIACSKAGRSVARSASTGAAAVAAEAARAQRLDQRRDGALLAVVAERRPRERDGRRRVAQRGEQVALLVLAALLDRHVGQHGLERAAQRVGEQRILAHEAREHVAAESHHEELRERAAARLERREQRDAAARAAERLVAERGEGAPQQHERLVVRELELRAELLLELRERRVDALRAAGIAGSQPSSRASSRRSAASLAPRLAAPRSASSRRAQGARGRDRLGERLARHVAARRTRRPRARLALAPARPRSPRARRPPAPPRPRARAARAAGRRARHRAARRASSSATSRRRPTPMPWKASRRSAPRVAAVARLRVEPAIRRAGRRRASSSSSSAAMRRPVGPSEAALPENGMPSRVSCV